MAYAAARPAAGRVAAGTPAGMAVGGGGPLPQAQGTAQPEMTTGQVLR